MSSVLGSKAIQEHFLRWCASQIECADKKAFQHYTKTIPGVERFLTYPTPTLADFCINKIKENKELFDITNLPQELRCLIATTAENL